MASSCFIVEQLKRPAKMNLKDNNTLYIIMRRFLCLFLILFAFTSCEESISYKWSEINESLGQLQDAREELGKTITKLESEGYDCFELKKNR